MPVSVGNELFHDSPGDSIGASGDQHSLGFEVDYLVQKVPDDPVGGPNRHHNQEDQKKKQHFL